MIWLHVDFRFARITTTNETVHLARHRKVASRIKYTSCLLLFMHFVEAMRPRHYWARMTANWYTSKWQPNQNYSIFAQAREIVITLLHRCCNHRRWSLSSVMPQKRDKNSINLIRFVLKRYDTNDDHYALFELWKCAVFISSMSHEATMVVKICRYLFFLLTAYFHEVKTTSFRFFHEVYAGKDYNKNPGEILPV